MHASRCLVDTGEAAPLECRLRGRLARTARTSQSLVVVGDRVRVEGEPPSAVVTEVLPRRNELTRMSSRGRNVSHVFAANVDLAVITAAVVEPPLRTGFVDRCLASARLSDIDPCIVLNKADLLDADDRAETEAVCAVYVAAGFPCHLVSVSTGEGLGALETALQGKTSVVVGQSGVGKTSLLGHLLPGEDLRTGAVSDATGKGKHTTTRSRLFPLPRGGYIVDTPGVRSFGLEKMSSIEVSLAYPEIERRAVDCRFSPCSHVHEPRCEVRAAVEAGDIARWRYDTYVRIVEGMADPL